MITIKKHIYNQFDLRTALTRTFKMDSTKDTTTQTEKKAQDAVSVTCVQISLNSLALC